MKSRPTTNALGLFILLAFGLLSGCAPSAEQIAAQTATAQTAEAALWTATPTATAVPTETATPTVTPSPSASPVPTRTATPTPEPTDETGDLTRFTLEDVTFSLALPEGLNREKPTDYIFLSGPKYALSFSLEQYNLFGSPMEADGEMGIPVYSAIFQDRIANLTRGVKQISEDFLETPVGEPYFRWVMEHNPKGQALHNVYYIFGSGKWFLTVMYTRAASDGAEWDEQIDAAMKTLKFEE